MNIMRTPNSGRVASCLVSAMSAVVFMGAFGQSAYAANWSVTEVQYQHGNLDAPGFAGGGDAATNIITFQHASGWKYGDNFFFIDYIADSKEDGVNDSDFYGEWYSNFSLSKITGNDIGIGPISDVGIVLGVNAGADPNVRKYLPGIRLSWDVPGFAFLNTDFTAYIDDSGGVASGGAPSETDSFMVDINWSLPFQIAGQKFSIVGHVEYIGERENEFGEDVSWWILAQPQFRYDLGYALWDAPNEIFVGIEWQIWINKLGDEDTDENAVQALAVWRF